MSRAQLHLLRQVLGAGSAAADLPLERVRRNFDKLFSRFPTLDDVSVEHVELGGVACEIVDARAERRREPEALCVHLHGGGFVVGSPRSHRNLAARLSRALDATVVVPEYRLAPEHPFPAQLEDALAVWGALGKGSQTSLRILSGDSAGAGLALLVASRLARGSRESIPKARTASEDGAQPNPQGERSSFEHRPQDAVRADAVWSRLPDALVCLSPWADYAATTPSLDVYDAVDPLVDRAGLERMASYYLGGRDPWDPAITPLRADLSGLPPTLIQTGGEETLQDDARRLAERLREHGVDVRLDVWEGMTHAWHLFAGRVDEAQEALDAAAAWVRKNAAAP